MPTDSPVVHAEDKRLVARLLAGDERRSGSSSRDHYRRLYRFALRSHGPRHGGRRGRGASSAVASAREPRKLSRRSAALHLAVRDLPQRDRPVARKTRPPRSARRPARGPSRHARGRRLVRCRTATIPRTSSQREQRARHIQVALDRLPPRYGDALEWKYVEGFSAQEIAARLNIGLEAANSLAGPRQARVQRNLRVAARARARASLGERDAMNDAPQQPSDEPADDLAALFGRVAARERPPASARSRGVRGAARAVARRDGGAPPAPRMSSGGRRGRFAAVVAAGYVWLQTPRGATRGRSRRSSTSRAATSLGATIGRKRSRSAQRRDVRRRPAPRDRSRVARRAALARRRLAAARRALAARVRVGRRRATHGRQPVFRLGRRQQRGRRLGTPGSPCRRRPARSCTSARNSWSRVASDEVVLSVREGQVKVTGDGFELVVDTNEELDLRADGARERDRDRRARRALGVGRGRRAADRARRPHDVRRHRVGRARDRPPRRLRDADAPKADARDDVLRGIDRAAAETASSRCCRISRGLPTRFATTRSSCRRREPLAARGRAARRGARRIGQRVAEQCRTRASAARSRPSSTRLRAAGLPLAYSTTAAAAPSLTVRAAPRASEPVELVREILAPHGLTLRFVEGLYIVVRARRRARPPPR